MNGEEKKYIEKQIEGLKEKIDEDREERRDKFDTVFRKLDDLKDENIDFIKKLGDLPCDSRNVKLKSIKNHLTGMWVFVIITVTAIGWLLQQLLETVKGVF